MPGQKEVMPWWFFSSLEIQLDWNYLENIPLVLSESAFPGCLNGE